MGYPGLFGDMAAKILQAALRRRNTLSAALANLLRLEAVEQCPGRFSIIVADDDRRDVAKLVSFTIDEVRLLFQSSEISLQECDDTSRELLEAIQSKAHENDGIGFLVKLKGPQVYQELSSQFLEKTFGRSLLKSEAEASSDVVPKLIDLGVVSYAYGHTVNINKMLVEFIRDSSGNVMSRIWAELQQFHCLDGLLQARKVWVFRSRPTRRERLYLSAKISQLDDLWGPVWANSSLPDFEGSKQFSKYEVGGGSVLPWTHDPWIHPVLDAGERLCHWQKDFNVDGTETTKDGLDLKATPFSPDDQLLIGATPPRLRFERCKCSKESIITELRDSNSLYPFRTRRGHHYIDSTSKGVSGGQYISVNTSKTKKWEKMITWKQAILDEWEKNTSVRGNSILLMEYYIGVVVSVCTMNATRVRLVQLLGTDSMKAVLEDFKWVNPDCKRLYFEALDDPDYRALRRLWKNNPDFQDSIGDAITASLKILSATGYDEAHDEFNALWVPIDAGGGDADPEIVRNLLMFSFHVITWDWTLFSVVVPCGSSSRRA